MAAARGVTWRTGATTACTTTSEKAMTTATIEAATARADDIAMRDTNTPGGMGTTAATTTDRAVDMAGADPTAGRGMRDGRQIRLNLRGYHLASRRLGCVSK